MNQYRTPWRARPVDTLKTDLPMVEIYDSSRSVVARRISNPEYASLITAAPELLEGSIALIDALLQKNSDFASWDAVQDLLIVIKKARGK